MRCLVYQHKPRRSHRVAGPGRNGRRGAGGAGRCEDSELCPLPPSSVFVLGGKGSLTENQQGNRNRGTVLFHVPPKITQTVLFPGQNACHLLTYIPSSFRNELDCGSLDIAVFRRQRGSGENKSQATEAEQEELNLTEGRVTPGKTAR